MKPNSPQWRVLGEPASDDERQALERLRALLPDDAVTHGWANVSFIDLDGRTAECDLLLLSRVGFFVVELKGWHGTIGGDQQHWRHTMPSGRVRVERNPVFGADLKAKRLRSLLEHTAPNAQARRQVPFIDALVVLHGTDSTVELPDVARHKVVALDGYGVTGLDMTLTQRLNQPPDRPAIDGPQATQIVQALGRTGIRPSPKVRYVGQYSLEKADPLGEGANWQDVLAANPSAPQVKRRIRVFDVKPGASQPAKDEIARNARRELVFTQGITHPGITVPLDLVESDLGPALIFDYDDSEVPLDRYLDEHGAQLGLDQRIDLVRQLADILRYAHARRLVHRALSPSRVFVRGGPQLVVRDWQSGRRSTTTGTQHRTPTATGFGVEDVRGLVEHADWVYLAPEAHTTAGDAPPIPLDVYGLGALAYLILTGHAPAATLAELDQRLQANGALDPRVAQPDLPDPLAELVVAATRRVESDRLAGIAEFLDVLDDAEDAITAPPEEPEARPRAADPLTAARGEMIAGRFEVKALRGTGSTGTALLVDDYENGREGDILKIAKDDAAARRLADEAEVLALIGKHPRIVQLLDGPLEVDGRAALLETDAGATTLAGWLESQGKATLAELERFGGHLLEAVTRLDELGLFHRDVKPANLGVRPDPGTRVPSLVLFDLSLAREPIENTGSGTRGYLDPYLALARTAGGTRARRRYDRAAELYAVAVTLFEMATTNLPWWSDGDLAPASPTDRAVVTPDMFEKPVAAPLAAFFRTALAPDVADRFPDVASMAKAWQGAFLAVGAEQSEHDEAARDEAAAAATLDTPLAEAGLSARALSALARIDAGTVGELLRTSPMRINSIPGLGERHRKEVQRRVRQWRAHLLTSTTTEQAGPLSQDRGVEAYLTSLLPKGGEEPALRVILGLDGDLTWPDAAEVARISGRRRDDVAEVLDEAATTWRTRTAVVDARAEVLLTLAAQEGIATLDELAAALLLRHGSVAEGPDRLRRATGLVRAVVEADARTANPELVARRPRSAGPVLVARRDTEALLDEAAALGEIAKNLSHHGVVPAAVAREEMRSHVMTRLSDDRLLRLAAAAGGVHVSSMDELYPDDPADLGPERAVEVALRGLTVAALTEAGVRRRVARRFPALAELPPRPALDRLVEQAVPGLRWDGSAYARPERGSSAASSTTFTRTATDPVDVVDGYLRASLRSSSALTLCCHPREHDRAVAMLERVYGVTTVDVAATLLTSIRTLADHDGVDWDLVLRSDAAQAGPDWDALRGLVVDAARAPWAAIVADERALLLVNAAPLARYGLMPRLSELLDQGTPRPAARWLLVPRRGSQPVPTLDGHPVPLGANRFIDLPHDLSLLGVPA